MTDWTRQPAPLPETRPGVATLPFAPSQILVVSDLHLGPGQEAVTQVYWRSENFVADRGFQMFLRSHADGKTPLLILAGDTFDFLRITATPRSDEDFLGWLQTLGELGNSTSEADLRRIKRKETRYGFETQDYKCVWKLLYIARGHSTFFAALGEWIAAGGYIVLLKGNHDVELYWPLVQAAIRREIGLLTPTAPVVDRLLFAQGGLQVDNLYVEHGHRFEHVTAVIGEPVLAGGTELRLPLGSFVNRYIINSLENIEPFLDNQKPVQRSVMAIARKHPGQILRILWHGIPVLRRAFRPYWWKNFFGFAGYFLTLLVPVVTLLVVAAALIWPATIGQYVTGVFGRFKTEFAVAGFLAPYLLGLIRDVWPARKPSVGEDSYGENMDRELRAIPWPKQYHTVHGVLGHTHRPDVQRLPRLGSADVIYANSGTWIPCWEEHRPDLAGRVLQTFLRFRPGPKAELEMETLEWITDSNLARPATIFSRERNP